jgi:hypothetical protein
MLGKGILNSVQLLETALRLLGFPLHKNQGAGEFVGDFIPSALKLFLAAGQILEALLLLLDLILLLAQLEQLGLGALDLVLKFLCRGRLLEIEQFIVVFLKV